ncbi:MAG: hypothetical protein WA821_03705 [Anaerolineales bacterium]
MGLILPKMGAWIGGTILPGPQFFSTGHFEKENAGDADATDSRRFFLVSYKRIISKFGRICCCKVVSVWRRDSTAAYSTTGY